MRREIKKKIQAVSVFLFVLYLLLLIYFLFFAENFGRVMEGRQYSYNLCLFREIRRFWTWREELGFAAVFTNLAGNVLCFLPFGAILPVFSQRTRNLWTIALLSFEFSLAVECIQLVTMTGSFDVDDLVLNTLGGVLGFGLFCVCDRWRKLQYG